MTAVPEIGEQPLLLPRSRRRTPPATQAADVAKSVLTSVWFGPLVLMLALSLWRIGQVELWQDELVSLDVSHRSTSQILALTRRVDGVHRVYYLTLHYWVMVFGDSTASLRMPSVLAMVGATVFVALTGRRLFGRSAGLAAGLVFALVPTMARYAQEARSYAFIVFAASLATFLLLRALESPRWYRWLPYALAAALLGLVHVVAMTLLAGHAVVVAAQWWRRREHWLLIGFAGSGVVAAAGAYPVISLGRAQANRQIHWIPPIHFWDVYPTWNEVLGSAALAGFLAAAAVFALARSGRAAAAIALIAVLPLPVVYAASQGSVNYFFPKYLMFTIPAWAVLAGAGLAALGSRRAVALGAAVLAVVVAPDQRAMHQPLSHMWYTYPDAPVLQPLDYRGAADVIAKGYQAGDDVVYGRAPWWWMVDVGVKHYLPTDIHPRDVFQTRTAAENNDLFSTECSDPVACLGDAPRLWVAVQGVVADPLTALPGPEHVAISQHYRMVSVTKVAGMTVGLLARVR